MKTPDPDDETILYGETAAERMVETWDDIGQGKVGAEVTGPWLIIDRDNGKYRAFISLVDDTMVLILNPDATTRHVPKEYGERKYLNIGTYTDRRWVADA